MLCWHWLALLDNNLSKALYSIIIASKIVSVTIFLQYPSQQKHFGVTVLKIKADEKRNLTIVKCGGQLDHLPPLKTMRNGLEDEFYTRQINCSDIKAIDYTLLIDF